MHDSIKHRPVLLAASLVCVTMLACDPAEDPHGVATVHEAAKQASSAPKLTRVEDGSYTYDPGDRSFMAVVLPTGEVEFRDFDGAAFSDEGIRVNGPTEWAAKLGGGTAHAREKAAFLKRTEARRYELAQQYTGEVAEAAQRQLREQLNEAGQRLADDPEALRTLVFELWDECAQENHDAGASPVDKAQARHASAARAIIEGFVRRRMARGTDAAYTDDELERLNEARTSRMRFDPYDQW